MFRLLKSRFSLLLITLSMSAAALSGQPVAVSFALIHQGRSAATIGLVLGILSMVFVLSLLIGGIAGDRLGRSRVVKFASILRILGTLLSITSLHAGRSVAIFAVSVAVVSLANGLFMPNITGMVLDTSGGAELAKANGMRGVVEALGTSYGPAAVGLVVAFLSPEAGLMAIELFLVICSLSLFAMRYKSEASSAKHEGIVHQLRVGFVALKAKKWCWSIIAGYALMHLLAFPAFYVLGPIISQHHLGGARSWGIILGLQGLGSIIGSLSATRYRFRYPLRYTVAFSFFGASVFIALGVTFNVTLIAGAALLTGFAFGQFQVVWETFLQLSFEVDVLSRVSSYDWMGSSSLFPVGQIATGIVATLISPQLIVLFAGVVVVAISGVLLSVRDVWGAVAPRSMKGYVQDDANSNVSS
ncbi:MAG: MFS transporter [Actinomycetota bacterium]|nr:MFS transporter [Actinomycetota bacterium]